MKKRTKRLLGVAGVLVMGTLVLSSCTASFCSDLDRSNIMRAYEPGVIEFHDEAVENSYPFRDTSLHYTLTKNGTIQKIDNTSIQGGMYIPVMDFWKEIDFRTFDAALEEHNIQNDLTETDADDVDLVAADLTAAQANELMVNYGYVKYFVPDRTPDDGISPAFWSNFENWSAELKFDPNIGTTGTPTATYARLYRQDLDGYVGANRSCIALYPGDYGHYAPANVVTDVETSYPVPIVSKSWGDAFGVGFIEGLIVYPVAFLVESFSHGFGMGGWGQVGAIIITTIIVRLFLQLATFWGTRSQIRMQALQPEVQKIQAKYPNSKENKKEQERLAMEQQQLYKKHKVRIWLPILVMVIQFPIFISVWGAMTGAASLSSDAILGLRLSETISGVLFGPAGTAGWWTALVLFIIMAITQIGSMLLPRLMQWYRKKKMVNKLGPQPKQRGSGMTNIVSIVMVVMIIIMGFSLPAGMCIYWIIGAIISAITSVVTHFIGIKVAENMKRFPNGKPKRLKAKTAKMK